MNRRNFMKLGAVGAVGIAGLAIPLGQQVTARTPSTLASRNFPRRYTAAFKRPPVLRPYATGTDEQGDYASYSVTAMAGAASIVPGLTTTIYGYNGIFPGPTISVERGTRSQVRVRNRLPALHPMFGHPFDISTHLHGSASLPQFDGYANDVTSQNNFKNYEFPNFQDARTLWYHDHGVHHTAENMYGGLAATYHLHDEFERGQLPQGEFDVPLVISDAMFAADGSLAFDDRTQSGLYGDVILVNGVPWPTMKVKPRVYRFRFLVASISRSYRFSLSVGEPRFADSTGEPMTLVATDAGMLPVPVALQTFRQGTAERYEILIDFSNYSNGTRLTLLNGSNPKNNNFAHTGKVMQFEVTDTAFDETNNTIPTTLDVDTSALTTMALTPSMAKRTTRLRVNRDDRTNAWTINEMLWEDVIESGFRDVVASPDIGDVELWEIENRSGGWFHPMHIHLVDFKILSRNSNDGQPFPWERGPKDVVYLGPNDKVKLLVRFDVPPGSSGGRYMVHCHNLVHEDHDMMVQFKVGQNDPDNDPNDPITAALPGYDDLPVDVPMYEPPVAGPGW